MITQECPRDVVIGGDFKTTSFKIAQTGKMFELLSKKVYTYDVQAVIREYCCNALDAHIDAGQDEQFRVHLPTTLEPWFAVRDFGYGLCEDDVRGIYAIYGFSTKTGSNDFIGNMGIGAKSGFAICDSFTVTSYYGGHKSTYSCYVNTVGEPQVALLTREDSDEPTGIEVKMTVNGRSETFKREAVRVFQYFDVQPVINLREVVDAISVAQRQYEIVSPQFSVSKKSGSLMAVMGNVAYTIPDHGDITSVNIHGFLRFDIGQLNFDPGRETLSLDQRTVSAVNAKIELFRNEIQALVEQEIEQQPTFYKKCVAYDKLNAGALGNLIRLKDRYKLPESSTAFTVYQKASNYRKTVSKSEETEFTIKEENRIFFMEPRFEARIRNWLKQLGKGMVTLVTPAQADELKIDHDVIEKLDLVIPKLDKVASGPRAANFKTFVWNGDTHGVSDKRDERSSDWDSVTIDVADTTEEKVYVELNNWKIEHVPYWVNSTEQIQSMATQCRKYGVELPEVHGLKTAILKQKAFEQGKWIKLQDYIRREITAHAPKTVYQYNGGNQGVFRELALIVSLPEIDALVQMFDGIRKANYNEDFWAKFGISLDFDTTPDTMESEFFAKFPMLKFVSDSEVRRNPTIIKEYVDGNR